MGQCITKGIMFMGISVEWVLPASSHLQQCLISKGHDTLKDDDICTIQCFLKKEPRVLMSSSGPCNLPPP